METTTISITEAMRRAMRDIQGRKPRHDLTDRATYGEHARFVKFVADNFTLAPERRRLVIDDDNRDVLRFLLYYFNDCPLAEEVFPGRGYKLHKNILLQGPVGVGKTLIMKVFAEYLRRIGSPRAFFNVSVTEMVNWYTLHNNLDLYTYHEEGGRGFQPRPENLCLNDVGLQDKTYFGTDTGLLTDEFLHARDEIWAAYGKFAHLTTNLDNKALRERFGRDDPYGRLVDRFKSYNIIPIGGKSRR